MVCLEHKLSDRLADSAVDLQWRINSGVAAFALAAVVTTPVNNSTTIAVSGTARYDSVPVNPNTGGLSHLATTAKPIRGAVFEIYSSPASVLLSLTSSWRSLGTTRN